MNIQQSKWMLAVLFLLTAGIFSACTNDKQAEQTDAAGEVNVYTHRHYDTDKVLFAKFEEETGIKVNVVKASADQLIQRLETEGENSPADVLITVDAGRLVRAKAKDLLQSAESATLAGAVPASLRDPDNQWFGLTQRARIIVYSKERVDPATLSTYEALTEDQWKGKILVRSSSNLYNQSLMASIIQHQGQEGAQAWAEGVVANMARDPKGNDRDQVKAIAAGQGDIALVNTYYIGKLLASDDPAEVEAGEAVGVFFPNQEGRGAHVNVSGAGVCAHAPNKASAIKFLEFLASPEAQAVFAESNFEYPVNAAVPSSELLQSWGEFKADALNLSVLGELNEEAVKTFDLAGWK